MSGKLSRAGNTRALNAGLGATVAVADGQFLALMTTAPTDTTPGTEYDATGYARQAVTWNAPTAADPPVVTNDGVVTFGPFTLGTGAEITHVALMDDVADNDVMLAYWTLTNPRTPDTGDSVDIEDETLTMSAN